MNLVGIPRSASHPHLPSVLAQNQPPVSAPDGLKRTFSETILTNLDNGVRRQPSSASDANVVLSGGEINGIIRRNSGRFGHNSKIAVSRFAVTEKTEKPTSTDASKTTVQKGRASRPAATRSVSGTLSTFARNSWIGSSRSPSPSYTRDHLQNKVAPEDIPPIPTSIINTENNKKTNGKRIDEGKILRRRNTLSSKKTKRPLSALLGKTVPLIDFDNQTLPSIPKSFSTDRLPSYNQNQSSSEKLPIVPRSKSSERWQGYGSDIPRKKDELWSTFRTLDGEYQKYVLDCLFQISSYIDMFQVLV